MVKRYAWFIGWTIAVLVLAGCGKKADVETAPTVTVPEGTSTAVPSLPPGDVILVDGELVSAYPPLKMAFQGSASGELLALQVRVGQRVKGGAPIATMDDAKLREAVEEAELALERTTEDKRKFEADAEKTYQRQKGDAEEKYEREAHQAESKYQYDLEDAQRAVERAQRDLERAQMQPPTTAVAEAKASLAQAIDQEQEAADNYKQALDRPWENQRIRDSFYREWQIRIRERELAELRLQDAQIALQVYYADLEAKERELENAEADLARVEKDTVKADYVEKETSLTYDRAIADAERKLADAQEALSDARLYAPWDGIVVSIDTSEGAMIGSGTPVITLLKVTELYFVTENLSERHVAQLHPGQGAEITLRTYPDTTLAGHVETIIPRLERSADADTRFTAYIRLDDTDLDLLPGMSGRVEIVTGQE